MATINTSFGLILLLVLASVAEFGMAKRCTNGIGECGERLCCLDEDICGERCCDRRCKESHTFDLTANGYCNRIGASNLCSCEFEC